MTFPPLRVAHLTTVHRRDDTRIFLKELRSLVSSGCEASLLIADGLTDQVRDGVRIVGLPRPRSRFQRVFFSTRSMLQCALQCDVDIYHLHDPELLTIARALKRAGKIVIFDAHEDLPKQILSKHYIPQPLRNLLAKLCRAYEVDVCGEIDAIVAATPAIADTLAGVATRRVTVNNYPLRGELALEVPREGRNDYVAYIGGMSRIRGIAEVIDAAGLVQAPLRFVLGGEFGTALLRDELARRPGWARIEHRGWLDRVEVARVLGGALAGIVTFLPEPNHIESQPNKMFEYMSAGIPVVASDFPLWRDIVEGNRCGLCVDPRDPMAIARAIDWLASHPEEARAMGTNGRRAVEERFNWSVEERKLVALYQDLHRRAHP